MTITATAEEPKNANVYDLRLTVVTEGNRALFPPTARVGDIYKSILLPSGALALVPLREVTITEIRDEVERDPVDYEGRYITLTAAAKF